MALHGAISTAVLMSGPKEKIRQEVYEKIHLLGKEGGYFCAPDQSMPFPKEYIDELKQAVEQYGRYPLA